MVESVTLRHFQPADQGEAKALILAGLAEHWGEIDPTLNPDLDDIAHSYGDAIFIVGIQESRIVGTGALVPRAEGKGEIVRMSVAADLRRAGVGTRILERLCQAGKEAGYTQLILETTATWSDVVSFYKRFGFRVTHYEESEFGRDAYFALDLDEE